LEHITKCGKPEKYPCFSDWAGQEPLDLTEYSKRDGAKILRRKRMPKVKPSKCDLLLYYYVFGEKNVRIFAEF
jgi:hypothetical protein